MTFSDTPTPGSGRPAAQGRTPLSRHRLLTALGLTILAIVAWALYAPGLGGGFVFDDYPNIVDNPLVQPSHASLPELTAAALSSPSSELKRPLASLSFAANFLTTGLDPAAMKATNIVLHILNGWLIFFFCRTLLRKVYPEDSAGFRRVFALGVALAWLVAPINFTAVLYIVQRMESLANLFVLIGLIGYVHLRARPMFRTRDALYCGLWLILLTGLGLLAKETAVLLPLYALCIEAVVFRFGPPHSHVRKAMATIYGVILAAPFIAGMAWIAPSLFASSTWATRDFTLATRLMSEPRIILDYVAWTIAPTSTGLSFYHDDFVASTSLLTPWTTLASMTGLLAMLVIAWFMRRRMPLLSLGLILFLAAQSLTGTVLPLELVYEHRNYFASMGIMLAVADACRYFAGMAPSSRGRAFCTAPALALITWSMILTFTTASAWGTPLSLAEELGRRGPHSHRAQYELGRAYIIASRYDRNSPYILKSVPPLEAAAAMPGASVLAEQALIFVHARAGLPVRETWWTSMRKKLRARPATVQDESSLGALSQCLDQSGCHFEAEELHKAFDAAMDQPNPSARLCSLYADFALSTLEDNALALRLSGMAVTKAPSEPVYRVKLAQRALAARDEILARQQIAALRAMNFAGRLDGTISSLEGALTRSSAADAR